jgi:hypothetical protein
MLFLYGFEVSLNRNVVAADSELARKDVDRRPSNDSPAAFAWLRLWLNAFRLGIVPSRTGCLVIGDFLLAATITVGKESPWIATIEPAIAVDVLLLGANVQF